MYLDYYGLTAKPFQLNPDPRFFYASKVHRRAMAYLEYGLNEGQGFIVITGDIGAGKTTLVRNLLATLDSREVVAAQLVSTQLDADDLLRMVASAFSLPHEGLTKATLLERLQDFLLGLHRQGKRALLLVDEAQNLSRRAVEELRMLSNFQHEEKSLVQSFLLGQPEFRQTLQSPGLQQLRERVIASYHLGPLDAEETRAYILHRLHTVGWTGDPKFTDDAFDAIFEHTTGIPRRVNILCDRLMLLGYLEERHDFTGATVREVSEDWQKEVAASSGGGNGASHPAEGSDDMMEDLVRLEARVDRVEVGLDRVRGISQRLLSLASELLPEKGK